MFRLIIILLTVLVIFSSCGHEHPNADQATISLEEIKPTIMATAQPITNTKEAVDEVDKEEILEESEEVVELKDEQPVEKTVEPEKVVAKPVKKEKKAPKKSKKRPKIEFAKTTHYFGLIEEGETIRTEFFFDNVGDAPLLIKDASATCGCTYPGYPFVPIKPGERSSINVSFNSKGKFGKQKPVVTVMTNASSKPIKLYLEGEVKTEVAEN
ncbi:MAG: DUF1573 domain-containing protein [Saprospiraceae bacterium]